MSATPDINKILKEDPREMAYGAPMGDSGWDDREDDEKPVYLQRLRLVDGDYGADGTYWGGGHGSEAMWCAFNVEGTLRRYVRADTRQHAIEAMHAHYNEKLVFHNA